MIHIAQGELSQMWLWSCAEHIEQPGGAGASWTEAGAAAAGEAHMKAAHPAPAVTAPAAYIEYPSTSFEGHHPFRVPVITGTKS